MEIYIYIGLAQETQNSTENSFKKKIKHLNKNEHMFFFGSGISRNLSLAPHKHRGTLPCTKAPAPPTIPDVKSENPSLFGHQLAEQNGVANVGETSSWLEKVRTEYGVLRKKSALYL